VPVGHGSSYSRDITHLVGEVRRHEVHVVGEVLPHTGQTSHVGLPTQFPFGSYFAGHTGHLGGEGAELIHHRINGVLELQNFALHVHRDLLGQVTVGHGRGHSGDVTHL